MLIVWKHQFIKKDGNIYITGSSSNKLFSTMQYYMRRVEILGWEMEEDGIDVNSLEKFQEDEHITVKLYNDSLSFLEKIKVISNEVKKANEICVKLPLIYSMIACHYARKYKKPYVVESGGDCFSALWYHGGSIKYKCAAIPMDLLTKYYHRKAKYIIYVSKFFMQKKYPSKAIQIGCPDSIIDIPNIDILNKRIDRISSHTNNRYVLGLIGATQAEYRGHDVLIRVLSYLNKNGYNVEVKFLGGGKADNKRFKLAQELHVDQLIEFCGRKSHDDVLKWIDDIDILIMPTKVESLGRSIIEAMSRGCPVIGSVETAIGEQIGSDCLASSNDVEKISEIVMRMIDNKGYITSCAFENFYRSYKYSLPLVKDIRQKFYDKFYSDQE